MRPAKTAQSSLRAPLNWILGTEANVRILRELAATRVPLGRAELAERCGLSLPGASAAIDKLLRTGMIELVGGGGQQLARLRAGHPLGVAVETLFRAESIRVAALFDELRAVAMAAEGVRAAWIEGPVADGSDVPNEPVVLGFLAGSRDLARLATALSEAISLLEREYDLTIEVRGRTEADLATVDAEDERVLRRARTLFGPHPTAYLDAGGKPVPSADDRRLASHAAHDEDALAAAAWIAGRLDRDPGLPERARSWLVHRIQGASDQERHELMEWLRLLETASIPRLQHILLAAGERSTRLRQSNPFLPVLTDAERSALSAEVRG
jgi:DNA-binding transcriptional ArsR family regulator